MLWVFNAACYGRDLTGRQTKPLLAEAGLDGAVNIPTPRIGMLLTEWAALKSA
jgi:hypothetical protein